MADEDTSELAKLRRAVVADPRNAELRYLLGAEMAEQQDYEGAVLEITAAVALNPQLHIARFQLGLLHLTMGQPEHTQVVLGPLEELPDDAALKHFKHGLEALIVDQFAQCVAALRKGIELNKDNEPLNRDMSMLMEKVLTTMAESPEAPEEKAVRTDFSLYGDETRH